MSLQPRFADLAARQRRQVIGQEALIDGLLASGHLLLEGPPGVAKTRAVRVLAGLIDADFHRIQFTPDLLPADLTGGEVFRPQDASFRFERGPSDNGLDERAYRFVALALIVDTLGVVAGSIWANDA